MPHRDGVTGPTAGARGSTMIPIFRLPSSFIKLILAGWDGFHPDSFMPFVLPSVQSNNGGVRLSADTTNDVFFGIGNGKGNETLLPTAALVSWRG